MNYKTKIMQPEEEPMKKKLHTTEDEVDMFVEKVRVVLEMIKEEKKSEGQETGRE